MFLRKGSDFSILDWTGEKVHLSAIIFESKENISQSQSPIFMYKRVQDSVECLWQSMNEYWKTQRLRIAI